MPDSQLLSESKTELSEAKAPNYIGEKAVNAEKKNTYLEGDTTHTIRVGTLHNI